MSEPIHIISLGAGVQSSTMALMAAHGEITPMPKCAIFADTQAEPRAVYEWLGWLEKQLPFPVHRVTRGSLTEAITTLRERKDCKGFWVYSGIPAFNVNPDLSDGKIPRQCTTSFKIEPLDRECRKQIGISVMKDWRKRHILALKELSFYHKWLATWKRYQKDNVSKLGPKPIRPEWAWLQCQSDPLVVTWIGISLDEVSRMKPPRHPWQNFRWPMVDARKSRGDCLEWMKRNGFPEPPRSACVYCPYHSDAEWRRLPNDEFQEAVRVDKEFRRLKALAGLKGIPFVHSSRVPLDQVDFSTDEDHGQQVMFGNECDGMCGV